MWVDRKYIYLHFSQVVVTPFFSCITCSIYCWVQSSGLQYICAVRNTYLSELLKLVPTEVLSYKLTIHLKCALFSRATEV